MQQYFVNADTDAKIIEVTNKDTLKHMFQVMRLANGDEVVFAFQDGIKRRARLIDREAHLFQITETLTENVELPVSVTIACGFPKGDKLAFIMQKSTELGTAKICAFPADRSIVRWDDKKLDKLQDKLEKVVLGAAEQSKRNIIPEVKMFKDKKTFIDSFPSYDKILIAYEEAGKSGEKSAFANALNTLLPNDKLLFIFGPEGGITDEEIKAFEDSGGICVGLGARIMRAETAPLYVLSAVSYALELNR